MVKFVPPFTGIVLVALAVSPLNFSLLANNNDNLLLVAY